MEWPSCSPNSGIPNSRAPHHAEPKSFSKAVLGKTYRWPCPQESTSAAFSSFRSATHKCATGCDPIFKPSMRWSEETRTCCTVQLYFAHQFYPHTHQVTKSSEKSHSKETKWTQHSQNLNDHETFCFLTLTDIWVWKILNSRNLLCTKTRDQQAIACFSKSISWRLSCADLAYVWVGYGDRPLAAPEQFPFSPLSVPKSRWVSSNEL